MGEHALEDGDRNKASDTDSVMKSSCIFPVLGSLRWKDLGYECESDDASNHKGDGASRKVGVKYEQNELYSSRSGGELEE